MSSSSVGRVEGAEGLVERAAAGARQEDHLDEPILGDLAPVLARELEVRVGEDVRQAEGRLTHGHRHAMRGDGGEHQGGEGGGETDSHRGGVLFPAGGRTMCRP